LTTKYHLEFTRWCEWSTEIRRTW